MASLSEYFKVGKLASTFGFKGEVILRHHLGKKTSLKDLKAIFIEERKESFIPWFLHSTQIKSEDETIIKLEGVDTKEQAAKLIQKEVWLEETDFKKFAAKSSPINLIGYTMIEEGKEIGKILEVIEQPHQVLCTVSLTRGAEAYIPLHEESLLKIDHKNKKVTVALPPGLLEIYQ